MLGYGYQHIYKKMIEYKYNLKKDLSIYFIDRNKRKFFENNNIVFFNFNIVRFFIILYKFYFNKLGLPKISVNGKITCYIKTCGTWGSYSLVLKNEIHILPWKIKNCMSGDIKDLIIHELKHLLVENEVQKNNLSHQKKEELVNNFKYKEKKYLQK